MLLPVPEVGPAGRADGIEVAIGAVGIFVPVRGAGGVGRERSGTNSIGDGRYALPESLQDLGVAKIIVAGREQLKATFCGGEPVCGANLLGIGEYLASGEGVDGQLEMLAAVYSVFVQAPKVIRSAGLVVDYQGPTCRRR